MLPFTCSIMTNILRTILKLLIPYVYLIIKLSCVNSHAVSIYIRLQFLYYYLWGCSSFNRKHCLAEIYNQHSIQCWNIILCPLNTVVATWVMTLEMGASASTTTWPLSPGPGAVYFMSVQEYVFTDPWSAALSQNGTTFVLRALENKATQCFSLGKAMLESQHH